MAILMKYGGFKGDSLFERYEGFCILGSVAWGFDRRGFAKGAGSGQLAPDLKAILCTAPSGSTGAMILREALGGKPETVQIVVGTWSGTEGVEPLVNVTLGRAQVGSYATGIDGDAASDSFMLKYDHITMTFSQNLPGPDGRMARRIAGALSYAVSRPAG